MAFDIETLRRRMQTKIPGMARPNTLGLEDEEELKTPQAMAPVGLGGGNVTRQTAGSNPGARSSGYLPTKLNLPQFQSPNYESINDFDFDRTYADQNDMLSRARLDAESQYNMANQQDEEAYQRAMRSIQKQTGQAFDQNADRFAGQGILRSGIAVDEMGNIGEEFQGQLDEFNRRRTEGSTARESQYAQVQRQIQEQLGRLQEERTRRQQVIEQARARQAAEAAAAQRAAQASFQAMPERIPEKVLPPKPMPQMPLPSSGNFTADIVNGVSRGQNDANQREALRRRMGKK